MSSDYDTKERIDAPSQSPETIDLSDLLSRISQSLIAFDTVSAASDSPDVYPSDIPTPAESPTPTNDLRYLIFTAGTKSYGFATEFIEEVIIEPLITPIPGLPDWVVGVFNVHGEIASIIHFDRFITGQPITSLTGHSVILVQAESQRIGILVDGVRAIHTFSSDDIFSPPFEAEPGLVPYLHGLIRTDSVIHLLDCRNLLTNEVMQQFT